MDQYNNFRSCVIREKKVFRSIVGDMDLKKNPGTITDYLEKHFKEKEAKKKQRQMLGAEGGDDLLRQRIERIEEETTNVSRKRIDTVDFKKQREVITMGGGGPSSQKDDGKYM